MSHWLDGKKIQDSRKKVQAQKIGLAERGCEKDFATIITKKVGKRSRHKAGREEMADRFSREKDDQEARDEAEAKHAENR